MKCILTALTLSLGFLGSVPTAAGDTLLIERTQVSDLTLPKRGASMAQVRNAFGEPTQRFAPVGGSSSAMPPITRWQYPGFSVYFEHKHVVDAVVDKASPLEIGPAPPAR